MNIAICAATPFQTLNAINLSMHSLDKATKKILFYRNYSETTNRILENILRYDIFDEVYEYDLVKKDNKFYYIINDLIQATCPRLFIRWITKKHIDVINFDIDLITVTSGTEFEVALTRIFPEANTIAYDDGLGSYVGDIVHDHKLKWIWRFLGRKTDHIKPDLLYVNNVTFCKSTLSKNKKQLSPIALMDKNEKEMYMNIFGNVEDDIYSKKKLIYLSQPTNELGVNLENSEKEINKCLLKFKNQVVYRRHPRDISEKKINFSEDQSSSLWELICEEQLSNDSILLSICSSSQIIPKLLYNKEPWIIFTYKLYGLENSDVYKNRFKPVIEMIKQIYNDKKKVLEPTSIDDLEIIIVNILKGN